MPSDEHAGADPGNDMRGAGEPRQTALALASTFAEALAREPDLFEGLSDALRRCVQVGLLSAGCVFEAQPDGSLSLCAHAGLPGTDGRLGTLCSQAWTSGALLAAGLPLHVPSSAISSGTAAELLRHADATAALLVPLNAHGARLGLMVFASRDHDLAAADFATGARVVAAQVARALADDRAHARAEASARLQRTAFDHARDAILILDDDGRTLAANGQAEQVLDRSVSEIMGRRPLDFVVPEDVQVVSALRTQLIAQGSLAVHRIRVGRPDGRVVDVDATAARIPNDGGFVQILVLRDMTNRRGAREALAAGEERFRALVESTGDMIFTLDSGLRVTGVFGRNPLDAGLDAANPVGKSLGEVVGANAQVHEPAARRALAGEVVVLECSAPRLDGTRHLQTSYSPIRASDGVVRCLVGVTRDVTERRQLQTRLLVANHMGALSLLAGSVSQELSNPVAAVLTNLSHVNNVLADMQTPDAAGERAVDLAALMHLGDPVRDALAAADQLRHIAQDLRSLTRATEEQLGPVDVGQVLDTAVRMAATELKGRARVVRQYHETPVALGNEARLVQVFLSLLVNAAQACPERGDGRHEIRLTTRRDARGWVVIEVLDDGPGIAPEDLGRVFEPFFTTKPAGVGTGLGLSIARRIVDALDGRIEVETLVGQGTTVRVVLPPADRPAHRPAADAAVRVSAAPEV